MCLTKSGPRKNAAAITLLPVAQLGQNPNKVVILLSYRRFHEIFFAFKSVKYWKFAKNLVKLLEVGQNLNKVVIFLSYRWFQEIYVLCFPICRTLKVCQKSREIVGGVKIQMQLHKDFVLPQNSRQQRLTFGDFNVSAH